MSVQAFFSQLAKMDPDRRHAKSYNLSVDRFNNAFKKTISVILDKENYEKIITGDDMFKQLKKLEKMSRWNSQNYYIVMYGSGDTGEMMKILYYGIENGKIVRFSSNERSFYQKKMKF